MYSNKHLAQHASNLNLKAVIWVLVATAIFSLIFASGKLIGNADLVWHIIFFRYLAGLAFMLFIAKYKAIKIERSPKWHMHFLRAFFGGAGGCAAIYAAANMAVADAAAIGLLDGVIAVMLGIFIFSERVTTKHWLAILGCLVGAAIILSDKGAFQNALDTPALIALLGAILLALESAFIRALATKEKIISILLHVNFFGVLLFSIPAIYTWNASDLDTKLLFCLLGPLALLGQYCNIQGYKIAPLSIVAPVGYSWILFALAIDYFMFNQVIGYITVLGAILIIASGYLLATTLSTK